MTGSVLGETGDDHSDLPARIDAASAKRQPS